MPRGTAFDLEVFKTFAAVEVKKKGEETATIWTPGTGNKFRLCGFSIYLTAANEIELLDEGTAFFITQIPITTNVLVNFPMQGYLSTKAVNKLKLNLNTATAKISGAFYGVEE